MSRPVRQTPGGPWGGRSVPPWTARSSRPPVLWVTPPGHGLRTTLWLPLLQVAGLLASAAERAPQLFPRSESLLPAPHWGWGGGQVTVERCHLRVTVLRERTPVHRIHRENTLTTEMRFPRPGTRERTREARQARRTAHVQGPLRGTAPSARLSPAGGAGLARRGAGPRSRLCLLPLLARLMGRPVCLGAARPQPRGKNG